MSRGSGTFLQARHILSGENWGKSLYTPSDTRGDNASLAVVKTKILGEIRFQLQPVVCERETRPEISADVLGFSNPYAS